MIVIAAFVALLAQDCQSLLPPADLRIEWFRNGRPYAVDQPTGSTRLERQYRRTLANGRVETRTLSCTGDMLVDRTASARISIPVDLPSGASRRVGSATVQRIQPPAGARSGSTWYYISHLEAQRVGVRPGIGIEEIQTLGRGSDVDVLVARVVRPDPAATASIRDARQQVAQLEARLSASTATERVLRDSIAQLRGAVTARNALRDTLRAARDAGVAAHRAIGEGARMIADSAARLPSGEAARVAALTWPGAGQIHLGRGGSGWALVGGIAAAGAITALVLPDSTWIDNGLDPGVGRIAGVAGSAALYIGALLAARSQLHGMVDMLDGAGLTRESFLRHAEVAAAPDGGLRLFVRIPR